MKLTRLFLLAMLAVAFAAPVAEQAQAQSNLLANGGFEASGGNTGAAGWAAWWAEIAKPSDGSFNYAYLPKWNQESISAGAASALIYGGNSAQRIFNNWDPYWAGIKQVVNVPAGSRVRLTAYGRLWAAGGNWPTPSDVTVGASIRVGIDPNGSDNAFGGGVVWSGGITPHNAWQPVSVEATVGSAGKVGVFISASYMGNSRQFLASFFDEASLVVVDSAPAPGATSPPQSQPTSAQAPVQVTPFLTPTPGPDGNIIYIVQPGDTLWRIAGIAGLTVDQVKAMNGLSSDIISVGQRLIIGQGAASASPTVAASPTDANAATAVPTAEVAATTAPGETQVASAAGATMCALMYEDVNGNGRRDTTDGMVVGGVFTIVDTQTGAPVQGYTTTSADANAHCFESLAPGAYTISSASPTGYNATTGTSFSQELRAGDTVNVEFGAQPSGTGGNTASASTGNSRLRTALFGAAGIVFLLLAAGVAGFLVLRRR